MIKKEENFEEKYNFASIEDILIFYKSDLHVGDEQVDYLVETIANLVKIGINLENFKKCDYLKNLANFSLNTMCDNGVSDYYYSHFFLIVAFLGFLLQFLGNYYGEVHLEIKFFEVFA